MKIQQATKRNIYFIIAGILFIGIAYVVIANPGKILTFIQDSLAGRNEVVAIVDEKVITQGELEDRIAQIRADAAGRGQQIPDQLSAEFEVGILNVLINELLVLKAAEEIGALASDELVEQQLDLIKSRFSDEEKFKKELEKNHYTRASFKENVKRQLTGQLLVAAMVPPDRLAVAETELVNRYDEVTAGQNNAPPLESVRAQIENDIKQRKIATFLNPIITRLRRDAKITVLLAAAGGSGK